MVFIDQRGTGGSHPLDCKLFNPADPQSYLGYFFPLEDVRKCRQELEPKANLKLYTTPIAMDDLDEVRAALGYERLNLFGGSYGTRAALVYLKRHPQSVRTVTLQGVAPTNQFMPRDFAAVNERALQGIIAECAGDEACNKAFPNLREETKAVLERLMKGPIEVEVGVPSSGPGQRHGENYTLTRFGCRSNSLHALQPTCGESSSFVYSFGGAGQLCAPRRIGAAVPPANRRHRQQRPLPLNYVR